KCILTLWAVQIPRAGPAPGLGLSHPPPGVSCCPGRRGESMLPSRRRKRLGFNLVELVLVISIVGVLAGLVVVAVQKLREADARIPTINPLKLLGMPCHNCNDVYKRLPPGQMAWVTNQWSAGGVINDVACAVAWNGRAGSLHYHLMPYLE